MLRSRTRSASIPNLPPFDPLSHKPPKITEFKPSTSHSYPPFRRTSRIRKRTFFCLLGLLAVLYLLRPTSPTASSSRDITERLKSLRKSPYVDRAILDVLADLETERDPDERATYYARDHSKPGPWPPLVTRIPEVKPVHLAPQDLRCVDCDQFLFVLRVAEQESKAHIHLEQILELGRALNRTVVLPNVGKSRVGACFRWNFEVYYELPAEGVIKPDMFKRWLEIENPTGRVVSFAQAEGRDQATVEVVHESSTEHGFPPCFERTRRLLRLEDDSALQVNIKASADPTEVIQALSLDASVLVLSWDLRHPIFPQVAHPLTYASHLHQLAAALAPSSPYVMMHWRMEGVPPAGLVHCAHAAVDLLAGLPMQTVWLASDYPFPIRSTLDEQDHDSMALVSKSGTFRDVGRLHAAAMGILGDAFAEGGLLEDWTVAELTQARLDGLRVDHVMWEPDILDDPGVRAIVDKLVGIGASAFVSGAARCARVSSFTRQIVQARNNRTDAVYNVVDYFE
ncbi:unnamed protein product [Mycena citricolor]|uniref:Proteophosphoglycan 5 n=1 Tax=Mycena citricolor TaxID=2018698 RepID=A0AAD2JY03_9AGAR|nr:unnamed protein product [Mycena citricolor]